VKLLYFAWVRERIGRGSEELELPAPVTTAGALMEWLEARGPGYAAAFADRARIRIAINQDQAGPGDPVTNSDEVAFFPPVTGG